MGSRLLAKGLMLGLLVPAITRERLAQRLGTRLSPRSKPQRALCASGRAAFASTTTREARSTGVATGGRARLLRISNRYSRRYWAP